MLAALVLFHLTHQQLGRYWSVTLDTRKKHKLIADGVYARVRHPMYSAFWLLALAQAALLANWVAGLSGIVGWGILFFFRIGREEQLMIDTFGAEYRDVYATDCTDCAVGLLTVTAVYGHFLRRSKHRRRSVMGAGARASRGACRLRGGFDLAMSGGCVPRQR